MPIFKEYLMKDPILLVQKYNSKTSTFEDVCKFQLQYFTEEQTFDLFDHEYIKRYDTHFYHKRGEMNCRTHASKVLFGEKGFVYSFAKVYAKGSDFNENDHLVVKFSGYENGIGAMTVVLDLLQYLANSKETHTPIIDDYDLLMQKYKEIT
jgi:hypothetical protein